MEIRSRSTFEALARLLSHPTSVAPAFPFQLSGRMARRVLIATATALKPAVLIADEPALWR